MNEHTHLLKKWLRVLFYVHIGSLVITAINAVSDLDTITIWVGRVLSAALIWAMFQMREANPRYRGAAVAYTLVLVCGLATAFLSINTVSVLVTLAASVCSLVASYQEYHAHSEVVEEQDEKLSKQWSHLFWVEILVGLGISLLSTVATLVLVSAEMDSATITTIIFAVTSIINLLLGLLYLLYMNRTLKLLETREDVTYGEEE